MEEEEQEAEVVEQVNYDRLFMYAIKIPFPSQHYAETAMATLGVDLPFQDTKNKKTTIRREMWVETL